MSLKILLVFSLTSTVKKLYSGFVSFPPKRKDQTLWQGSYERHRETINCVRSTNFQSSPTFNTASRLDLQNRIFDLRKGVGTDIEATSSAIAMADLCPSSFDLRDINLSRFDKDHWKRPRNLAEESFCTRSDICLVTSPQFLRVSCRFWRSDTGYFDIY